MDEDTNLALSGLTVSDPDAGSASIQVVLSVNEGTIAIGGFPAGLVSGNNTGTVTLTGSQADINSVLSLAGDVLYRGDLNDFGPDTLTVTTNDLGATGTGGAQEDVDTVSINVTAVNDAPTPAVNAGVQVVQGETIAIPPRSSTSTISSRPTPRSPTRSPPRRRTACWRGVGPRSG